MWNTGGCAFLFVVFLVMTLGLAMIFGIKSPNEIPLVIFGGLLLTVIVAYVTVQSSRPPSVDDEE